MSNAPNKLFFNYLFKVETNAKILRSNISYCLLLKKESVESRFFSLKRDIYLGRIFTFLFMKPLKEKYKQS